MDDAFVVLGVGYDGEHPEVFLVLIGHEHGPFAGKKVGGIDLVELDRFADQLNGDIPPAFDDLTQTLRQIIQGNCECAAGANPVFFPQFIVTFDKSLGDNAVHRKG